MKYYLSPSIMCGDLLNLETEIKILEKAKVELIHFDIMDTTFTNQTMLPFRLAPMISKITNIPLDIHVMIDQPERIVDTLTPLAKNNYIEIHYECTRESARIYQAISEAGGHPAVVINTATPVSVLEETLPYVDMINLILGNAGCSPRMPLNDQMLNKISKTRKMIDDSGKDIILEVDGAVNFDTALKAKEHGANSFVLGTSSIYRPEWDVVEQCDKFRKHLGI